MRRIVKRVAAKRDLIVHFAFIAEGSPDAARRFLVSAEKSFQDLAEMPYMGAPRDALSSKFADIRLWRVTGFENYLILYRPRSDGIAVERVIHAKQDYHRFLK
jgi:plasmid stabilization system protein ParE